MAAKKNFNLEEAIRQYEELSSIPEVVETSFRRQMAEMDRMAREEDAVERGMKKGMEKGKLESKREIAKKLLNKKINIQTIMETTGLTKEELESIA